MTALFQTSSSISGSSCASFSSLLSLHCSLFDKSFWFRTHTLVSVFFSIFTLLVFPISSINYVKKATKIRRQPHTHIFVITTFTHDNTAHTLPHFMYDVTVRWMIGEMCHTHTHMHIRTCHFAILHIHRTCNTCMLWFFVVNMLWCDSCLHTMVVHVLHWT